MRTHHTTLRSKFARQGLQFILPLVVTAWLAAPSLGRADLMQNNVFSDASATYPVDITETIAGSFIISGPALTPSNANITLSGPAPFSGTYSQNPTYDTGSEVLTVENSITGDTLFVVLGGPLHYSPGEDESILSVDIESNGILTTSSSATGSIIFAPLPNPDPSALALLGTALAGLFLIMKIQQSPCLSGFICFWKINERAAKSIAAVQDIRVIVERKRARIDYDYKPETYKWEDIPVPLRPLKLKPRLYR